jgi:hypothetical protein
MVEPALAWPRFELDHLVVAARTLDEGVAWCEATLGVVPAPGGRHTHMGTHNALLSLRSTRFPRSYLEILAIDAEAAAPSRRRWFDLDTPQVQAALAAGPRLVHWVARCDAVERGVALLRDAGYDVGTPTGAERMTPRGLLRWRITLRDDGGRPAGGAVPLLIEWSDVHPCDALADWGVALESVVLAGVAEALVDALGAAAASPPAESESAIVVRLATPRGTVELRSPPSDA